MFTQHEIKQRIEMVCKNILNMSWEKRRTASGETSYSSMVTPTTFVAYVCKCTWWFCTKTRLVEALTGDLVN